VRPIDTHLRWLKLKLKQKEDDIRQAKARFVALTHCLFLPSYVLISWLNSYPRVYSKLNIYLMVAFAWAFGFGIMLPPALSVWGTTGLDESTFSCTILK